jgi:CMP-N-acetylneuraminic acid synthetase
MIDFLDLIISPENSLQSALEQMTINKKGLLFVCDESQHLVGVISDGDIRRALLNNALLISSIDSYMNLDPITARSTEEGTEFLRKTGHVAIPVIDKKGNVIAAVIQGKDQPEVIAPEIKEPNIFMGDVIAIIPARGGSKRIHKKNIAPLAGKPLIAYAIEAARNVTDIAEVLVSTDDQEIAVIARNYGADVPWLRPATLAQDNTPSIEVVIHAVEWLHNQFGNQIQYGVLLEPTAPLRTPAQIAMAIELLKSTGADSVVSVSEVPHVLNPEELLIIRDNSLVPYNPARTLDKRQPRQNQTPVYAQNGLVYAFRLDMLLAKRSLYGERCLPLIIDWNYFVDIDTPADFNLAEYKINAHSVKSERE